MRSLTPEANPGYPWYYCCQAEFWVPYVGSFSVFYSWRAGTKTADQIAEEMVDKALQLFKRHFNRAASITASDIKEVYHLPPLGGVKALTQKEGTLYVRNSRHRVREALYQRPSPSPRSLDT